MSSWLKLLINLDLSGPWEKYWNLLWGMTAKDIMLNSNHSVSNLYPFEISRENSHAEDDAKIGANEVNINNEESTWPRFTNISRPSRKAEEKLKKNDVGQSRLLMNALVSKFVNI